MNIKIEKNIPVPAFRKGRARKKKVLFPYRDLDIGDSFAVRVNGRGIDRLQKQLTALARYYGKQEKRKFTTRRESALSVRVWRLA